MHVKGGRNVITLTAAITNHKMNFKKLTFYVYALNYSGNSIIAAVTYFRNLKKNHLSFYNGICIQEYKKPAFWKALIFLFLNYL